MRVNVGFRIGPFKSQGDADDFAAELRRRAPYFDDRAFDLPSQSPSQYWGYFNPLYNSPSTGKNSQKLLYTRVVSEKTL